MQELASEWRQTSDAQKEEYVQAAAADKERYAREYEAYDGPLHVPAKRAKKDKNVRKAARTAYSLWQQVHIALMHHLLLDSCQR